MFWRCLKVLSLSLIVSTGWAQQADLLVTESEVVKMLERSSPQLQQIESQSSLAQSQAAGMESRFETRANLSYDYSASNEEGLTSFSPVFSPSKKFAVGVSKNTPYGIMVNAEVFGDAVSTKDGTVDNAARTGGRISLQVDLLKNFLGRTDAAELKSSQLMALKAQAQSTLSKKEIELETRKLYWSLVANDLSLQLSKSLVGSAKTQLRDVRKRSRSGAADKGDVARNQALLASRQSSVKLFEYEKTRLHSQMKKWIPELSSKNIKVSASEINKRIIQASVCIAQIEKSQKVDENTSDYFKVINYAQKEYGEQKRKAAAVGDWDLKLKSYYQSSSVDKGFSKTFEVYDTDKRDGYGVGLSLSIPLEGKTRKNERLQRKFVEQRYKSEILNLKQQVYETHNEVKRALVLLKEASAAQKVNVDALATSLRSNQRKYRQARISLGQLIVEQDTLFGSQLQEIQTKVSVIHAIYDYFKVFNQYNCPLNAAQGSQI